MPSTRYIYLHTHVYTYSCSCIYIYPTTYRTTVTGHAHDCKESIKNAPDLLKYDAIITVSGDGLLLEALNGVMARKDWREVIQNVVLFPLPGGTGNGLVKSLLHVGNIPLTPTHAAYVCAKGHSRRMDVGTFETEDKGRGYSFLELMWFVPRYHILHSYSLCSGHSH